ncbi:hypothetical protein [Methylocystis sp.]|uniref:hypothetical protein n=1 Tax=Methylocystis sp. TaxID=1911079 RepID=UPI0025EAB365|nr:hypothetical protein [Methylocystis sp.]
MSVLDFLKTKKSSPAAAIQEMQASLERLRAERKEFENVVESHGARRAAMLLSDVADSAIAELDAAAALAQIRLERLEICELELVERIERARDSADRARLAAEFERAAAAIEPATKNLEAAIAPVAEAFATLVRSIPAETFLLKYSDGHTTAQPANAEALARIILAAALYDACPSIFEMQRQRPAFAGFGGGVERALAIHSLIGDVLVPRLAGLCGEESRILPASDTARLLLVSPLRSKAAALRNGDAEAA